MVSGTRHARNWRLSFSLAVAVSAALTIGLPLASPRLAWLGYVFTPLTMVLAPYFAAQWLISISVLSPRST